MDVFALKNYIIENPDYIELILEKAEFHNINKLTNEYRCAREPGRNPTSVKVNKHNLSSTCFSTNFSGDIVGLIRAKLNLSFTKTIKWLSDVIDFKFDTNIEPVTLPFGGFYKKIARLKNPDDFDLETYSDEILNQFECIPNMLFYEDGILPSVQLEFDIGYDANSSRITVPWYTFDGRLCGVMGRLNKKEIEEGENKWYPILSFPKSKTLYGFAQNYNSICEKGIVMIGESEKFTLQCKSFGLPVGISLGGSFLSEAQANNIKSLFPQKIVVCLDEGLDEEHSREIAKQLKSDKFYKNKVGYICDKENLYLPKGSKYAPTDLGKNSLKKLVENCTVWI